MPTVCDLLGEQWQVPGHLLLCYCWGASLPLGLCEEEAGARRVDGFINHRRAEGRQRVHILWIKHHGCMCVSYTHIHTCTHKKPFPKLFYSWQAAKAPKIALRSSWDSKDFKWVNTSFRQHTLNVKWYRNSHTQAHTHTERKSSHILQPQKSHLCEKAPNHVYLLIYLSIHNNTPTLTCKHKRHINATRAATLFNTRLVVSYYINCQLF